MGWERKEAVRYIAIAVALAGIPSALSLEFLDNQDFVWGTGLIVSGLMIAVVVMRFGVSDFRKNLINTQYADIQWAAFAVYSILGQFPFRMAGPFITRIVGTKLINPDSQKLKTSGPAIYVTNHTSALDIFISMAICPYGGCGIGKNEVVRIPFFGWAYWLSGHLLIDRGNREKAVASMNKLSKFVNDKKLSIWRRNIDRGPAKDA